MVGARIHAPGDRGPSGRYSNTGGASAALRHRPTRKQGLQGLRFAPGDVGQRAECRVSAGLCAKAGEWGRCEPGCVPGSQVCTPAKRKTARIENSMLARVCSRLAGWVAEIGPRAFAHGLTHRTQLHVTLYTRACARASREVTTTCVRCVRRCAKARGPISATQRANRLQTRASIEFSILAVFRLAGVQTCKPGTHRGSHHLRSRHPAHDSADARWPTLPGANRKPCKPRFAP